MSTDLGSVRGRPNDVQEMQGSGLEGEIHLARFWGGESGPCMQVTIGAAFVQLDEEGRVNIIDRLASALGCPEVHYRDILVALLQDPHRRATADSILNELHQHGWRVVPR